MDEFDDIDISEIDLEPPTKSKGRGRPKKISVDTTTENAKKDNYVDDKVFAEDIRKFYDTGIMTESLGDAIYKIANGLSFRPNFINYTFRKDMTADAVLNMMKALNGKKFDLNKGYNPFSYFNMIAFHSFCTKIKKEKKQRDAVEAFQEEHYPELLEAGRLRLKKKGQSYDE